MSSAPPLAQERLEKLRILCQKYEIKPDLCHRLRQLEAFEIIFVCDDSGSMGSLVDQQVSSNGGDPFASVNKRRWDELCSIVTIVAEIAACLDPTGIDVYFLNRPPLSHVFAHDAILQAFSYPPQGYTPIVKTLDQMLREKADVFREKQVLVILATDGEPTDPLGNPNIPEFIQRVKSKPQNMFLTIVACTDDDASIKYLNVLDRKVPRVDVVDDYRSERNEIQAKKGKSYPFTFGDYVAKILLGSIDPTMDDMDEKGCCTIL